jgi:hypothetical protein
MAVVLAGLVLVGGAVAALRLTGDGPDLNAVPPPPPLPTVIRPFTADGALAPSPGPRPAAPGGLLVTPGPRRLQVTWGADLPGGRNPARATGYDVRWGFDGALDHEILVSEPDAELDGLPTDRDTRVEVRSVDAFGQRSTPAASVGRALPNPPSDADDALVDHFDGARVPDPTLWRLASVDDCAQAARGTGDDSGRMVILSECGRRSVSLRSRAPLRLNRTGGANRTGPVELGRFTIDTDSPGEDGELDVDLVPGPVAMIDDSPNDPLIPGRPGVAVVDAALPPGTVRVRIAAAVDPATDQATENVQVAAGPTTPTVPVAHQKAQALPSPRTGRSARWDVVLRTDGVQVLRDGRYVAGGNVVPRWSAATALVEFSGTTIGQQRADVNMIGLGGAPTSAPPTASPPRLTAGSFVDVVPGATKSATHSTDTGPGSALLLLTAMVAPNSARAAVTVDGRPPTFAVRFGSQLFAAVPAVPGTLLLPQVRYPMVARIPAGALEDAGDPVVQLVVDAPTGYPAEVNLVQADLEVTPGPGNASAHGSSASAPAMSQVPPQLAVLRGRVLDANGAVPPAGTALPRGRAVLDVRMDGIAGQRITGVLAGLAGFEVWLDDVELVAVPTAVDGPGVAGDWQIAFDPGDLPAGDHTVDIRAYGAKRGTSFAESFVSFRLR